MICRCRVVDVVLRHLRVPPIDAGLSPGREVWCSRFGDQVEVVDILSIYVVGLEGSPVSVKAGHNRAVTYDMLAVTFCRCRAGSVC